MMSYMYDALKRLCFKVKKYGNRNLYKLEKNLMKNISNKDDSDESESDIDSYSDDLSDIEVQDEEEEFDGS